MANSIRTLLLFAFLGLHLVAQPQLPPLDALSEGDQLMAKRNYRAAAESYERVIGQYPADPRPYMKAAGAWNRLRRFRRAADHLRLATQIAPREPAAWYDLGSAWFNLGEWARSIEAWRQLEQLTATDPRLTTRWQIPHRRGLCAQKLDLIPEAIDALGRAVGMAQASGSTKEQADVTKELGGVLLQAGRHKLAAPVFERLVALESSNARHKYHLGICYMNLAKLKEARELFMQARRLDPKDEKIDLQIGKIARQQEKLMEARTFFDLAIKKNPKAYEPWYQLRAIYNEQNNLDKADEAQKKYDELYAMSQEIEEQIRSYSRRVKNNPRDLDAYFEHAMLLIQHNRLPEAQQKLQQLLSVDTSHELAIINLGQILVQNGRNQEAILEFGKIIERNPSHSIAHLESARSYARMGQLQPAGRHILAALPKLDRSAPGRYLGALQLLAGISDGLRRPDIALPEFEGALLRFQSDPTNLIIICRIYANLANKAGKAKEALPPLERALLSFDQGTPEYKKALELLIPLSKAAKDPSREATFTAMLQALNG